MSCFEAKRAVANDIFRFFGRCAFGHPSLIVCWREDTGHVGPEVGRFLRTRLEAVPVCEIRPADFFPLAGVVVTDNVAQFPESKFYYSQDKDVLIFTSDRPQFEHYKFVSTVLDVAQYYCKVRQLYTVDGMAASTAHTSAPRTLAAYNREDFQKQLRAFGLQNMDYEGPPAVSSFLLWAARDRGIPGASLWCQVPFYIAPYTDPRMVKGILSFFNEDFELGLDLTPLDEQVRDRDARMERLCQDHPEIDELLRNLESGVPLSEDEQLTLVRLIAQVMS